MKKIFSIYGAACLLLAACNHPNDEQAIKQLLEKESATWRSGDIAGHAACWIIRPYSKILASLTDGTMIDLPPSFMITPPPSRVGHGGSAVNSDYKFCIKDNIAWVSHNETSTAADGSKSYSAEIRMLEKVNGDWKLTGQSIHLYKPK